MKQKHAAGANAKIGVLVFPAGEINAAEVHGALSACVNLRLYGASSVDRHGEFLFKNYFPGMPNIREPGFIAALNRLTDENRIDLVLPTHDDVALFFARQKELIHAKVLTPDVKTAEICSDKQKTYETFADCGFCPQLYQGWGHFPVFIKPRRGQGGAGAKPVRDASEIPADMDITQSVICEYLPGEELTVDCFTDSAGRLQAALPRLRQRVFGGVSVRAQSVPPCPEVREMAAVINARLHFLGLWYFQVKQDAKGRYKLLEVSMRCAGTMCLSRALGVNLPLLSVYAAMGRGTEILPNNCEALVDRSLISRYRTNIRYTRVYIDLDDTLLLNGAVNRQAMYFLYQCVNAKKTVILITRHREDYPESAAEALGRHRIAQNLFDEIIELDSKTPKHTVMNRKDAIFIDNAFAERKAVRENLGIPVFDVDGIEALLDWRL